MDQFAGKAHFSWEITWVSYRISLKCRDLPWTQPSSYWGIHPCPEPPKGLIGTCWHRKTGVWFWDMTTDNNLFSLLSTFRTHAKKQTQSQLFAETIRFSSFFHLFLIIFCLPMSDFTCWLHHPALQLRSSSAPPLNETVNPPVGTCLERHQLWDTFDIYHSRF